MPRVELTGNTSGGILTLSIDLRPMYRAFKFNSYTVKLSENQPWEVVGEARPRRLRSSANSWAT